MEFYQVPFNSDFKRTFGEANQRMIMIAHGLLVRPLSPYEKFFHGLPPGILGTIF